MMIEIENDRSGDQEKSWSLYRRTRGAWRLGEAFRKTETGDMNQILSSVWEEAKICCCRSQGKIGVAHHHGKKPTHSRGSLKKQQVGGLMGVPIT